jgi:hypothetical protein
VLTKDIFYGMNILSLPGFVVMGLTLSLRRMTNAGAPLCIGLMCRDGFSVYRALCERLIAPAPS